MLPAPAPASLGFFTVRTGRGNWLAVGAGGEVAMADIVTPDSVLIACIPEGGPQTSFLIAPDGRRISIEGDGFAGVAISGRIRRVPGGQVELRHPVAAVRHLGVITGVPGNKPNRVLFDRVGDKVLDRFELHPLAADMLSQPGRALAAEIARAVRPPMGADALLGLLHAGAVRLDLAEALVRVLPADELMVLSRRLTTAPADLALLRRAMPEDSWLCHVLPGLLDWCARDRPPTRRAVSPAGEEHVSVLQSGQLRPQAGLALTSLARRTISPHRLACVLATARNEGPYLLDWIAYHRAVGFDHAVIYSNDNDDGSDDLLGLLADAGIITWVRNELAARSRAQWKAYGHAFKVLPDLVDYRWTMVLDLDEYFAFRPDIFGSVADVIGWHEHQHVEALALRWLMFTGAPQDVWRDEHSVRRFTRRDPQVSPLFKSLVRSHLFWDAHCHFPYPAMDMPFSYRIEDGAPCHHMGLLKGIQIPKDAVSADHAWVSHHAFRSAGEALMKVARGDATWHAGQTDDGKRLATVIQRFVALSHKPGLVDDRRTLACAPRLDSELLRLRAIPGVAACDQSIKHRFAERLDAVSQAYLAASPPAETPRDQAVFRSLFTEQAA